MTEKEMLALARANRQFPDARKNTPLEWTFTRAGLLTVLRMVHYKAVEEATRNPLPQRRAGDKKQPRGGKLSAEAEKARTYCS
jgi:hypothetical protein